MLLDAFRNQLIVLVSFLLSFLQEFVVLKRVVEEYLLHLIHPDAVQDVGRGTSNRFDVPLHFQQSVGVSDHVSRLVAPNNLVIICAHVDFTFED